jgi:hypothetical protein
MWVADQMSGRGLLKNIHCICRRRLPDDSPLRSAAYEGQFKNNAMHGNGTLILSNGQRL